MIKLLCYTCSEPAIGRFGNLTKQFVVPLCRKHAEQFGWIRTVKLPMDKQDAGDCTPEELREAMEAMTRKFDQQIEGKFVDPDPEYPCDVDAEYVAGFDPASDKSDSWVARVQGEEEAKEYSSPDELREALEKGLEEADAGNTVHGPEALERLKQALAEGREVRAKHDFGMAVIDPRAIARMNDLDDAVEEKKRLASDPPVGEAPGEYVYAKGATVDESNRKHFDNLEEALNHKGPWSCDLPVSDKVTEQVDLDPNIPCRGQLSP